MSPEIRYKGKVLTDEVGMSPKDDGGQQKPSGDVETVTGAQVLAYLLKYLPLLAVIAGLFMQSYTTDNSHNLVDQNHELRLQNLESGLEKLSERQDKIDEKIDKIRDRARDIERSLDNN